MMGMGMGIWKRRGVETGVVMKLACLVAAQTHTVP